MNRRTYQPDGLGQTVFTTGQAAAVLKVGQQTVIRLIDAGHLKGWKVPGSKFRRVERTALVAFARANNLAHALEALGEPAAGDTAGRAGE